MELDLIDVIKLRRKKNDGNSLITNVLDGTIKTNVLTTEQMNIIVNELKKKDEHEQINFLIYLIDSNSDEEELRRLNTIFLKFKNLLRKISAMS